jgi:murein DD-endopeptidase MepM/ murein hydrolase activator NlpD
MSWFFGALSVPGPGKHIRAWNIAGTTKVMKRWSIKPLTVWTLLSVSQIVLADAVPGGIYRWIVPEGAQSLSYRNRPVFTHNGQAIVGIPITETAGTNEIHYRLNGTPESHPFAVRSKQYSEQHITIVDTTKVDPPAQDLERIRDEAARQRRLYDSVTPTLSFDRSFVLPLNGITTSLYGHRRFFNGQPRSPHSGWDIAADRGTPIIAPAPGTVRLADDLFFNGNTIFLDHGQGLITMYCHLSQHKVAVDEVVAQGDVIGLVGATGRATGPHLHWSVSLNGYRVDPGAFMQAFASTLSASSDVE